MLALFAPSVFSSAPGSLQPPDHWKPHLASTGDGGGESNQRVQHAKNHNAASSPTVPQTELGLPQLVVIGFQKAGTTFLLPAGVASRDSDKMHQDGGGLHQCVRL